MINKPLLRKVAEHIEAHPDEHDQRSFGETSLEAWRALPYHNRIANEVPSCGTTMCAAGWTVIFAGHRLDWAAGSMLHGRWVVDHAINARTGRLEQVERLAADELGLNVDQAFALFFLAKTREDTLAAIGALLDDGDPRDVIPTIRERME